MRLSSLYAGPVFSVLESNCTSPRAPRGAEEAATSCHVALTYRGLYVMHRGREALVADPTSALFYNEGEPYSISHPVSGGDGCTVISAPPWVWADVIAGLEPAVVERPQHPFAIRRGPVCPTVSLACAELRACLCGRNVDDGYVEETLLGLMFGLARHAYASAGTSPPVARTSTAKHRRDLVERTLLELSRRSAGPDSLSELARQVGASPFHLSRVFRAHVGHPLHRHRLELRLALAVRLLLDTSLDVARIAIDTGFSDHSHLSRCFRLEYGVSPSALRKRARSCVVRVLRGRPSENGAAGV